MCLQFGETPAQPSRHTQLKLFFDLMWSSRSLDRQRESPEGKDPTREEISLLLILFNFFFPLDSNFTTKRVRLVQENEAESEIGWKTSENYQHDLIFFHFSYKFLRQTRREISRLVS